MKPPFLIFHYVKKKRFQNYQDFLRKVAIFTWKRQETIFPYFSQRKDFKTSRILTRVVHLHLEKAWNHLSLFFITKRKNFKTIRLLLFNYRGISLLSTLWRIISGVLLNILVPPVTEDHLSGSQCKSKTNRSTSNMVFDHSKLEEKCRERNELYTTFIDLIKAFDTVSGNEIYQIMQNLGFPRLYRKKKPIVSNSNSTVINRSPSWSSMEQNKIVSWRQFNWIRR